jgi:hypothetical protein
MLASKGRLLVSSELSHQGMSACRVCALQFWWFCLIWSTRCRWCKPSRGITTYEVHPARPWWAMPLLFGENVHVTYSPQLLLVVTRPGQASEKRVSQLGGPSTVARHSSKRIPPCYRCGVTAVHTGSLSTHSVWPNSVFTVSQLPMAYAWWSVYESC